MLEKDDVLKELKEITEQRRLSGIFKGEVGGVRTINVKERFICNLFCIYVISKLI